MVTGNCRGCGERLPLCRKYPESPLIFASGRLLPGCGYRFAVPLAKILRREMEEAK